MSLESYQYCYALVKRSTHMCHDVHSTTSPEYSDEIDIVISIPDTNYDYLMKYYDESTGKWYYDAEMTNEWIPPVE